MIEDDFPNGRPRLEEGGILFTDRKTVDKVEKMKVCTCLNPLHTCLAIYGCLLGYHKISDEMQDKELIKLVETVGYQEGLPVVINPKILNPKEFIGKWLTIIIHRHQIAQPTSKYERYHVQFIDFAIVIRLISFNSFNDLYESSADGIESAFCGIKLTKKWSVCALTAFIWIVKCT